MQKEKRDVEKYNFRIQLEKEWPEHLLLVKKRP